MTGLLAGAVLVVVVVWLFGSWPARVVGMLLVIDGLGGLVVHGGSLGNPRFVWEVIGGVGLWLFGHWLFAAKHGLWRSRVSRALWRLPVMRWTSPVRT